jgi:uncharacterized membrane protein YqiK
MYKSNYYNTIKKLTILLSLTISTQANYLDYTNYGPLLTQIETGYVGVRYFNGALQPRVLYPGKHFYLPGFSYIKQIKIQQDVDSFQGTWDGCGSIDAQQLLFNDIRVTNQPSSNPKHILDMIERFGTNYEKMLIENIIFKVISTTCSTMTQDEMYREKFSDFDDLIQESLTKFQEEHNTHLKIISVAVKRPQIKEQFIKQYELKTEEEVKIATEVKIKERVMTQKLTQKMSEEQDALRQKEVSLIKKQQYKLEAEADRAIQATKDAKDADSKKTAADAEAYQIRTLAAAEKERLTPEYLQSEYNRNVVAKAAAYYGKDLPKFVLQQPTHTFTTQVKDESEL